MGGVWRHTRFTAATLVFAVGGSLAAAQPANSRLTYDVSTANLTWGSTVDVLPADTVYVRTLLTYIGPGTAAGLSHVSFQPVISMWDGTDSVLNSVGSASIEPMSAGGTGDQPPRGFYPGPGIWGRTRTFSTTAYTTSTFLRGHMGSGTATGLLRISRADVTNCIGEGPTSGSDADNNWNEGGGGQRVPDRQPVAGFD